MAKFFISYRRADTGQIVGRISEKLAAYFGRDAVYFDVDTIPAGVDFADHIRKFIASSDVLLAVIGPHWLAGFQSRPQPEGDDHVRIEIELALSQPVPILPLLIGSTPMPKQSEVPRSIAQLTLRNALTIDAGRDFQADLNRLIQHLDNVRVSRTLEREGPGDYQLVHNACQEVLLFLQRERQISWDRSYLQFYAYISQDFERPMDEGASLFLHRIVQDSTSLIELHFLLTAWARQAEVQHLIAGWLIEVIRRNPILPLEPESPIPAGATLRVFPSPENARDIWTSITRERYQLSIPYVLRVVY